MSGGAATPSSSSSAAVPAAAAAGTVGASAARGLLPATVDAALVQAVAGLPRGASVLLARPAVRGGPVLRRGGGNAAKIEAVATEAVAALAHGVDCVVDDGDLAAHGLVFDLGAYRWDVLGRIEEVLRAIAALLGLVRPGGRLLLLLAGEPLEYLQSFVGSFFGVVTKPRPAERAGAWLLECAVQHPVTAAVLEDVLERELRSECSHRRYADLLDAALAHLSGGGGAAGLRVLDVGGGDGHMAEWWTASGHEIHLLEVDRAQADKARARLGQSRVTFHDGASTWPYAAGSFDVCLLLFVLHHILPEEALLRTLAEAARVTRRKVLVLEDVPHSAPTPGLRQLAAAVTAEHFRPFGQDPVRYMRNIRPDVVWRSVFERVGLAVEEARLIPGTLQHPVPHLFYTLSPRG